MKPFDVFPGSSKLVEGDFPPESLLLVGPSGIGKSVFCKQFVYNGLTRHESCIYLSTDEPPSEIEASMKHFGFDIEPYKKKGLFRIVDCYSWKLGGYSPSEFVISNPSDLTAISSTIENACENLCKTNFVLDSLTGLTSICSHHMTYFSKFLQTIVAKMRITHSNAIFTVDPDAHDHKFMSFLRIAFDGTLEMKIDETGKDINRLLRVFSIKGAKHKTNWTPFEITNKGIIMKSQSKLRCTMCSSLIEWDPIVEIIDGKKFSFDSQNCAKDYKKLKKLYGLDFE